MPRTCCRTINQPVDVSGTRIAVSASIGATTSMDGGTEPDQLLHEANVAIRRAKASGRGRIEVFDNRLRSELHERTTHRDGAAGSARVR